MRALRRWLLTLPVWTSLVATAVPAFAQPVSDCAPDAPAPALSSFSDALDAASTAVRSPRIPLAEQDAVLEGLIADVRRRRDERRVDPDLPRYVIQVDLDFTVFMPVEGTRRALRVVGERHGVAELLQPELLAELPHYHKQAFFRFLDDNGDLRARYPAVDWEKAFRDFSGASWAAMDDGVESFTPGIVRFVNRVRANGGSVVFNTGRRESTRAHTMDALLRAGIRHPQLFMKQGGGDTAAEKARIQEEIRARYGETIAIIDDVSDNREAVAGAVPGAKEIAIAVPGFNNELSWEEFDAEAFRISTFETIRDIGMP